MARKAIGLDIAMHSNVNNNVEIKNNVRIQLDSGDFASDSADSCNPYLVLISNILMFTKMRLGVALCLNRKCIYDKMCF